MRQLRKIWQSVGFHLNLAAIYVNGYLIFCNIFINSGSRTMKNVFAPLLALFLFNQVFAQQPCATEMPVEMTNWLRDYKMNNQGPYYQKNNTITYLPIKVHIAGTNAGGGYYKFNTLLDAFCTLNDQYRPYDWQFYIYEDINYINSDAVYNHTGSYQTLINAQSVPNVINMFFVADPSGACGYYAGFGGPQGTSGGGRQGFIAINNSCAQNLNSTIAHELGHFFSLPHTFYGWENRNTTDAARSTDERVNGSNCGSAGDFFCDTPADFISDRWNCPYNLTKTDFVGTPYNPDGSLYMSYANDACQDHHSVEQVDAMKSYLANRRGYMLNIPFPNYPVITDTLTTLFPATASTNIPANYANLKWASVPGATHYYLQVTRSNNINNLAVDTIVSDTSVIINNLDAGFTYRWRVRPFNNYSTCPAFSVFRTFSTTLPTTLNPVIAVDNVSCNGAFDGVISISLTGGQGPYTYNWSNGNTTSEAIYLNEGNYLVTVTDNNNQSLVLNIDLAEPDPLALDLVLNGTSLIAQTTGGNPPYTFNWSTGSTTAGIVASSGSYSVTITDSKGCTATKSYTFLVGVNSIDAASSLRIYPNPTTGAGNFTIEFTAPQAIDATIEVLDNAGRRVYTSKQTFATGVNVTQVPVSQLNSGVYFVRIVSKDVIKTSKLLVY